MTLHGQVTWHFCVSGEYNQPSKRTEADVGSDEGLMMTPAITGFWVDTDWCLAHYLCVDFAPVFFEMRDEGWAASVRPADFSSMSAAETNSVLWAAAHCPVAAIKVMLRSGEVVDANSVALKNLG
jgi:ferredoxin